MIIKAFSLVHNLFPMRDLGTIIMIPIVVFCNIANGSMAFFDAFPLRFLFIYTLSYSEHLEYRYYNNRSMTF